MSDSLFAFVQPDSPWLSIIINILYSEGLNLDSVVENPPGASVTICKARTLFFNGVETLVVTQLVRDFSKNDK